MATVVLVTFFVFITLICAKKHFEFSKYPPDDSLIVKDGATFAYIVVGIGTAGSIVVSRLTACGKEVVGIENGKDPLLTSVIPGLTIFNLGGQQDYRYVSIPNNISCLSMEGKNCPQSRGKSIGGSSAINYMIYDRGSPSDFDNWGVDGWSWDDLEKYFLRSEGNTELNKLPKSSQPFHNDTGPVKISTFGPSGLAWHERLLESYQYMGFAYNSDVNGLSQIGTAHTQSYTINGSRTLAADALINTANWDKLTLMKSTKVLKVILNSNNTAVGVKVLVDGLIEKTIYAEKEVIICAGAIETPALLMRSGIGPKEHLDEVNITTLVNLPVGEKYIDHVLPFILLQCERGFELSLPNFKPILKDGEYLAEWFANRTGPMAANSLVDSTLFFNSECYDLNKNQYQPSDNCSVPDFQFITWYIDKGIVTAVPLQFQISSGLNSNITSQIRNGNVDFAYIEMNPILLHPKSVGYIKLNKEDIYGPPVINPNYLSDQNDVDRVVKAMKVVLDLLETPLFKENNVTFFKIKLEACDSYEFGVDCYWECYIRHLTSSVFHGMSTCSLKEVVDENLRVYGVKQLSIADGSIMPYLPSASTAATCMAIGEKLADMRCRDC